MDSVNVNEIDAKRSNLSDNEEDSNRIVKKLKLSEDPYDSDCIIDEPNISVITVQDETLLNNTLVTENAQNEEQKNLFHITFKDNETFSLLKEVISKYLKKALRSKNLHCRFIENETDRMISVKETDNISDDDSMFIVDTEPDQNIEIIEKISVPNYKGSILKDVIPTPDVEKVQYLKPKKNCFNCDGDHNMMECPEPRDQNKVNHARKQFNLKNERYHESSEQKFGHFYPGKISEDLERALGLRRYEIPLHIYKMRSLGYPPGWLEEAKISHSGIALFDSNDKNDEEEENNKINLLYDIKKIISFPGYNVKTKSSVIDEHKRYGALPMLSKHNKEEFIKSLIPKNNNKTLIEISAKIASKSSPLRPQVQIDMDVEDEDGEIHDDDDDDSNLLPPGEEPVLNPVKNIVNIVQNISESETKTDDEREKNINEEMRPISPTLLDLKEKQKNILAALANSSAFLDSTAINSSIDDSLIDEIMELETTNNLSNTKNTLCETPPPQNKNRGTSISSENGTPILKQFSPFSKLPSGDAFSVGVSEVINFENLADSIGTYDKMRNIIGKVRDKLMKLNNNENV